MKKVFFREIAMVFLILTCFNLYASGYILSIVPRAKFEKIWVDYNVKEEGLNGMRIHLRFTCYEMKELDSYVAVYFLYSKGSYLRDKNNKFVSTDGTVAVYKSIKPAYEETYYNDLSVFMPYNELDLPGGKYDLDLEINLIYKQGGIIQRLTTHPIVFTNPVTTDNPDRGIPVVSTNLINVDYRSTWFNFESYELNAKGIRIYTDFTISGMKGKEAYLAVYFSKPDGSKLLSNNSVYRSNAGQLAAYKLFKPDYDPAVYKGLFAFIPYKEITVPDGRHELKVTVDLIEPNGTLIKRLTTEDIWIVKQ